MSRSRGGAIVNGHWCRNSNRFLSIFTFVIQTQKGRLMFVNNNIFIISCILVSRPYRFNQVSYVQFAHMRCSPKEHFVSVCQQNLAYISAMHVTVKSSQRFWSRKLFMAILKCCGNFLFTGAEGAKISIVFSIYFKIFSSTLLNFI